MSGLKSVLLLDNVDPICATKLTQAGISVQIQKNKLTKEELIEQLKVNLKTNERIYRYLKDRIINDPHVKAVYRIF